MLHLYPPYACFTCFRSNSRVICLATDVLSYTQPQSLGYRQGSQWSSSLQSYPTRTWERSTENLEWFVLKINPLLLGSWLSGRSLKEYEQRTRKKFFYLWNLQKLLTRYIESLSITSTKFQHLVFRFSWLVPFQMRLSMS